MKIFANGFSNRLRLVALENRPPATDLTKDQIIVLSDLAGYRLVDRTGYPDRFTIFHPDGFHGIDDGLFLNWHVRPSPNYWCLVFYPTLRFHYLRGSNTEVIEEMEDHLATFLPILGFKKEILIPQKEEMVALPDELIHPNTSILVMYLSEFQEKYRKLYQFLKYRMTPAR